MTHMLLVQLGMLIRYERSLLALLLPIVICGISHGNIN